MTHAALPPEADKPFILLDDASPTGSGRALLFRDPVGIISADRLEDVLPALDRIEAAIAAGHHVAGYIGYAASHAFEPRTSGLALREGDVGPLLWFGLFDEPTSIARDAVPALLPPASEAVIGPVSQLI